MESLEKFIIAAKSATYVGGGKNTKSCRKNSHDIAYEKGDWLYLDSYFGGQDFLGQEVVWQSDEPIWAMNYYSYILQPDLINAAQTGSIIKEALSQMYAEERFLGGFSQSVDGYQYEDRSDGHFQRFSGEEEIFLNGTCVYQLRYHGGLIRN